VSKFIWDQYSDQPYPIRDKSYKKSIRKINMFKKIKTHLLTPLLVPLYIHSKLFKKSRKVELSNFFGMGLSLEKGSKQIEFIEELDIKNLLIRFPISDIENIEKYIEFVESFKGRDVLINILQHREYLDSLDLKFEKIFQRFSEVGVKEFQIGNAINRTKWGFFSVDEYLSFYESAYRVRNRLFSDIELVGSSVIDFEFENILHTHRNSRDIEFDTTSSLLYVDRRGEPEGKQYRFFDLKSKIELLNSIVHFSKKSRDRVYITETNWPIKNTAPYTPTSQKEAVSNEDYSRYMVRYLLIAIATQKVERVYWHQLMAHGYGLIDKNSVPYPQYLAFKTIHNLLKDDVLQSYSFKSIYELIFENITVYWSTKKEYKIEFKEEKTVIDIFGNQTISKEITIGRDPIFIVTLL